MGLIGVEMRNKEILDSWKEISDYLNKKARTCYRWEKELGMPVHRYDKDSCRSKVFAYKSEIDRWLEKKSVDINKKSSFNNKQKISILISGLSFLVIVFTILFPFIKKSLLNHSKNPSIAVMPFENSNLAEYEEYLSVGIANEIVSNLSAVKGMNVIPPVAFAGNNDYLGNADKICKKLNVDYLLKGNIEKNESRMTIYAKIVRLKDGKCIWENKYETGVEEIFFVQQNICLKTSELLNANAAQIPPFSIPKENSYNSQAFDYYLKGKYVLNNIVNNNSDPWKLYYQGKHYRDLGTEEGNDLAIKLFNQAIHIDENFAQAYAGLAQCYSNYVNFNWDFNIKWIDKAEDLLKKAHSMSPDLPEYYSSLIQIYLLKHQAFNERTMILASELAQEGIEKYPDNPRLNSIIGYLYYVKFGEEGDETDFDKALEYKEKSYWMNPLGIQNIAYSELLMLNKEYFKAIDVCNSLLDHDPSLMFKFRLGEIHYYAGNLAESETIFQQFESTLKYKIGSQFYLGMISSSRKEIEKAEMLAQKAKTFAPDFFENKLKMASIYLGIGKKELGFECLDTFFDMESVRNKKYIYYKYIDIDRNFVKFKEEIRRKYYGEK